MTGPVDELLEQGRAALRAGDSVSARRALESAHEVATRSAGCLVWGDVLEGLARVSYLELQFPQAIDSWEQSYSAHRASQDGVGAVRVARTLAYMYLSIGRLPAAG
jgi:hypothetical protein